MTYFNSTEFTPILTLPLKGGRKCFIRYSQQCRIIHHANKNARMIQFSPGVVLYRAQEYQRTPSLRSEEGLKSLSVNLILKLCGTLSLKRPMAR